MKFSRSVIRSESYIINHTPTPIIDDNLSYIINPEPTSELFLTIHALHDDLGTNIQSAQRRIYATPMSIMTFFRLGVTPLYL